jgi:hypothetical protein
MFRHCNILLLIARLSIYSGSMCWLCYYSGMSIKHFRTNGICMTQIVSLCFKLPLRDIPCYDHDRGRICQRVYICVSVCSVYDAEFSVKYLSRSGTMCIFPLVNIYFSCYIFLHSISLLLVPPHWVLFLLYPLAATLPKLFPVRTDATILSRVTKILEHQLQ